MKKVANYIAVFVLALSFSLVVVNPQQTEASTSWTYLPLQPTLQEEYRWARTCKVAVNSSVYGPLWKVTFQAYRNNNNNNVIGMSYYRLAPGQNFLSSPTLQNQWLFGVVAGMDIYVSRYLNDRVQFIASDSISSNRLVVGNGIYYPQNLATCN